MFPRSRIAIFSAVIGLLAVLTAFSAAPVQAQVKPRPAVNPLNFDTTCVACKDFYTYANGMWEKANMGGGTFNEMGAYSQQILTQFLGMASVTAETATDPATKLVGKFYSTCIGTRNDSVSFAPVTGIFKNIDAISNSKSLAETMASLDAAGFRTFFAIDPEQHPDNAAQTIAEVAQAGLGLEDRDFYVLTDANTQNIRSEYLKHISQMLVLTGLDAATADAQAKRIMEIETRLAKATLTGVEKRNPRALYNLLTVAQLNKLAPKFDWQAYFNKLGVQNPGTVNVEMPKFVQEMNSIIATLPMADVRNYLRWRVIDQLSPAMGNSFVQEHQRFEGVVSGNTYGTPRGYACQVLADSLLRDAVGQAYVGKAFTPDTKARALTLAENIKSAMQERIQKSPWLTPVTRGEALKKLAGMEVKIGYPNEWETYATLAPFGKSHTENVLSLMQFARKKNLELIGKPTDKTIWHISSATINAYYSPNYNQMVFPAAILQSPMFDPTADDASNYGAIGAIIGHEMVHAFDDEGRQYDAQGNLRDWWKPEDAVAFTKRAEALVTQFNNIVAVDSLHVNGKLTLGENIADLGGLTLAYDALEKSLEGKPRELKDGLTPEQRFFIAFANSHRQKLPNEVLRNRVITDPHSPSKARVNGIVANMPEFAKAFGCKPTDPMVLAQRADLW